MSGPTTFSHPSPQQLAEALKIDPTQDRTCVGYAKSQRRRCHNPIRASNASAASELLTTISKEIASGSSVDELLEDLAHRVLCRAWHQDQATALSSVWSKQISKSQARCTSTLVTSRPERQCQQLLSTVPMTVEVPQTRTETGYVQLRGYSPAIAHPAASDSHPTPPASTTHQVSPGRRESESNEPATQSDTAPSPPTSWISPSEPRAISSSSSSPSAAKPSVATSQNTLTVTRRSVDDDCGICLMPLLHDDKHDDSDGKNKETLTEEDGNDPQSSHHAGPNGTSAENQTKAAVNDLAWCKVQCGTNYHECCIKKWVKARKNSKNGVTCPTCRVAWK